MALPSFLFLFFIFWYRQEKNLAQRFKFSSSKKISYKNLAHWVKLLRKETIYLSISFFFIWSITQQNSNQSKDQTSYSQKTNVLKFPLKFNIFVLSEYIFGELSFITVSISFSFITVVLSENSSGWECERVKAKLIRSNASEASLCFLSVIIGKISKLESLQSHPNRYI